MKFFFSFKIHCLQMFQLFQTKDVPVFFFIVTLVYTCRAFFFFVVFFFALSSENICPMYCFGHSSSQSVLQWNSYSPLKYIVDKCFSCFRPGIGHFLSSSHLSTLVTLFIALSSENICPIYYFGHSSSQSVSQWNSFFFSFKIHCLQMFQLFQTRDGPIFSTSHLSRFFFFFLLYHQKIFIPYIVLVTVRLSLFCNETLFLL